MSIDTMKNKRIKIVIDTDIGDDVDDSFAIALALKTEEIEVLGITTVYKNCEVGAQDYLADRYKLTAKYIYEESKNLLKKKAR